MIRLIFLLIFLAGCAWLGLWLAEHEGEARFLWLGYEITLPMSLLLVGLALLVGALLLLLHAGMSIWTAPSRLRRRHLARRKERGYRFLAEAFTAIAAGDIRQAQALSRKLDYHLKDNPIRHLIGAQTAQLREEPEEAIRHYHAMLEHEDTRFIGLRGLIRQAQREERDEEAVRLAEEAHANRPGTPWVLRILTDLYARLGRWDRARWAVEESRRRKVIDRPEEKRLMAALYVQEGQGHLRREEWESALRLGEEAKRLHPGWLPATLLRGGAHCHMDKPAQALSVLLKHWKKERHPGIFPLFLKAAASLPPEKRMKYALKALHLHPQTYEAHMLVASVALSCHHYDIAREHLDKARARRETQLLCRTYARLEEEAGNPKRVQEWYHRLPAAQPDEAWTCGECGSIFEQWHLHCLHCRAFDAVIWKEPARVYSEVLPPVSAQAALPETGKEPEENQPVVTAPKDETT